MKNLKIKSWLPMFEGFYSTCFDVSDNDYLINDLNNSYLLKEKGIDYLTDEQIELEGLISPKQYNYHNDSINCEYEITELQKIKIIYTIGKNWNKWNKYITEKYRPYSGFIPYYSNDVNSEDWNLEEAIEHSHKLGVMLEFILTEVEGYSRDDYYNDVLENTFFYPYIEDIIAELIEKDILTVTDQQKNLKELKENNATFDFKGVS